MLETFLMTVFCILAVYGAVKFIFLVCSFFINAQSKKIKRHTAIFLKNNEEEVESAIRAILLDQTEFRGDIIAVLKDSTDGTEEILRRLSRENEAILVMTEEEYIDFIKGI
ncbi:MAG: hypothetical protein IJE44_01600 [Clostridia bacterium]|nr:hypothetical protein [Clostridia bacterium]